MVGRRVIRVLTAGLVLAVALVWSFRSDGRASPTVSPTPTAPQKVFRRRVWMSALALATAGIALGVVGYHLTRTTPPPPDPSQLCDYQFDGRCVSIQSGIYLYTSNPARRIALTASYGPQYMGTEGDRRVPSHRRRCPRRRPSPVDGDVVRRRAAASRKSETRIWRPARIELSSGVTLSELKMRNGARGNSVQVLTGEISGPSRGPAHPAGLHENARRLRRVHDRPRERERRWDGCHEQHQVHSRQASVRLRPASQRHTGGRRILANVVTQQATPSPGRSVCPRARVRRGELPDRAIGPRCLSGPAAKLRWDRSMAIYQLRQRLLCDDQRLRDGPRHSPPVLGGYRPRPPAAPR